MTGRVGGVYVHFPYCAHHCHYCDFNVATPRKIPQERYTAALLAELETRAGELGGPARSLYIGGGTPSLWEPALLGDFVAAVRKRPGLLPDAEITLEANPLEVRPQRLAGWLEAGITRVSLGVQSLSDRFLGRVDRKHDATRALEAVELIRGAGFSSWSVDFMFALPGQTLADWREELSRARALDAPHLSVYSLTLEPRTMLAKLVRDGRVSLPEDGLAADMLFVGREVLAGAGYTHYEVSSYARPGQVAVHNSGYWEMRPYLGLGPGAHGFLPPLRWVNLRRPRRWIEAALAGERPVASEERLDDATLSFERVLTGLRRLDSGLPLDEALEARYGPVFEAEIARGRLAREDGRVRLTDEGLRWMDDVLLSFA